MRKRTGAVTVELALTLPILFIILYASIEFGRMFVLVNSAENAAYEGARAAIVPGATADDARTAARNVMASVGASDIRITVDPSVIRTTTEEVEVNLEVPMNSNGYLARYFVRGYTVRGSCRLTRERFAQSSAP